MNISNFPKVLIIILNWNNAPDTINCLTSLQSLDYNNHDIILIDNASSDDSVDKIHAAFPYIKIVENNANLGVAGGRNVGIELVLKQIKDDPDKAPAYILFLDNDTEVDSIFMTEMVTAAQAAPRIGVLGCKIYSLEKPDFLWAAGGKLRFSRGGTIIRGQDELDIGQFDDADDIDFALGCAFMVSRTALKHIGKFDPIFGVYFDEEVDWCIRAKNAGYRITYVPKARIWHRASRTTPGANYWQQKARNHMILMRRYATKLDWMLFIMSFPLTFFNAARYQIQHGNLKNLMHLFKGSITILLERSGLKAK